MPTPFDACGRDLLDVVPSVMRFIRAEMRSHREPGLSVPQFRALLHIGRNSNISMKEVAGHLGLTAATTSTLVDGLVKRGLARRTPSSNDRRRVIVSLTSEGCTDMEDSERETQRALAAAIAHLSPEEVHAVRQSMTALRRVFIASPSPERDGALLKTSKKR
jgi:DNA-binding MarR family transcriptional regulator